MCKIKWTKLTGPLALVGAMAWLSAVASAAPFVSVSGPGVSGQATLNITGLTVSQGSTVVAPTTYTNISSTASTTINGLDPSVSQKNTGPGFAPTTAAVTFNQSGGQTFSSSANPDGSTLSTVSEALTTAPPVTSNGSNNQAFFFTAANAGNINIAYAMAGHVQVDGTFAPQPGTTATANYSFGVDITTKIGSAAAVTTHVALEQGGVNIPIFGTIYSDSQDQNKALGTQFTLSNIVAGELVQLQFYETSEVTASVGAASAVPEPSSLLLACIGLVGVGATRFRRRFGTALA